MIIFGDIITSRMISIKPMTRENQNFLKLSIKYLHRQNVITVTFRQFFLFREISYDKILLKIIQKHNTLLHGYVDIFV